jgi:hypothetical protein
MIFSFSLNISIGQVFTILFSQPPLIAVISLVVRCWVVFVRSFTM